MVTNHIMLKHESIIYHHINSLYYSLILIMRSIKICSCMIFEQTNYYHDHDVHNSCVVFDKFSKFEFYS